MKGLLVIGSNGQLARALKPLCKSARFLDRAQADLAYPETLPAILAQHHPSAVINAAAYTQVDKAQTEEELATRINADAVAAMAEFCKGRNIPLVTFSSDYVFDGSGEKPWTEEDVPAPLNAYGRSKLAGEQMLARSGCDYLLLRTSWVYDAQGRNFVNAILRLAAEREELRVIDDQFGAPTYAPHLAQGALQALAAAGQKSAFPSGIYHLCNGGVTTWHGFAASILDHARRMGLPLKARTVRPVPASAYPLPAPRPHNSRLDCAKALSMLNVALPHWQDGLAERMRYTRENK